MLRNMTPVVFGQQWQGTVQPVRALHTARKQPPAEGCGGMHGDGHADAGAGTAKEPRYVFTTPIALSCTAMQGLRCIRLAIRAATAEQRRPLRMEYSRWRRKLECTLAVSARRKPAISRPLQPARAGSPWALERVRESATCTLPKASAARQAF